MKEALLVRELGELLWNQEDFFESRLFLNPKRGLLEKGEKE